MFHRRRTYFSFAAVILIISVVFIGAYAEGEQLLGVLTQSFEDSFYMEGNLLNGNLITYIILNSLWLHIPFLVIVITGEMVSGELKDGSLRMVLYTSVKRSTYLLSKYIAGIIYVTILMVILAALSFGLSYFFFGQGDLIVMMDSINVFQQGDLGIRFLGAFAFGWVGMVVLAIISISISVFCENRITPILISLTLLIVFTMLSTFNIGLTPLLKGALFTSHLSSWQEFFKYDINWNTLGYSVGVLMVYVMLFMSASIIWFKRKDITI